MTIGFFINDISNNLREKEKKYIDFSGHFYDYYYFQKLIFVKSFHFYLQEKSIVKLWKNSGSQKMTTPIPVIYN